MAHKTGWLAWLAVLVIAAAAGADVTISAGDRVRVEVLGEVGLSGDHTVSADGAISIPFAKRLVIANLTPSQAADRVAKGLSEYLLDPQVSVTLVERAKLRVTLVGAVTTPGALTVAQGTRLAELVAAGKPLPQADMGAVRIVHTGGAETVADLLALARGDLTQSPELAQDDLVIVPALTSGGGVRVLGHVKKPGLYPAAEEMTLWDAIAAAGGLEITASPRDAVLTRASGEKIPVDLTQLVTSEGAVSTVRLGRGDVLVVPARSVEVYVLGAVRSPGPYQVATGATLLDAIAQASGITPAARLGDAYLLRKDDQGGVTRVPVRLDLLLDHGETERNLVLRDGDQLVIPEEKPRKPSLMDKVRDWLPALLLLGL